MAGGLFMRALGLVVSGALLAVPAHAEMGSSARADTPADAVASSANASIPSPVLVVYGSANLGSAEARWLKALQPGSETRRELDASAREVRFVTIPERPSIKDWEEGGSLTRAVAHGVRVLPTVVFLDSKGRVFDLEEGGVSDEASLREKTDLVLEKARRTRPVTRVNHVPKGGDPAVEAAAICREMEQVPPEAWFRDYPGTMKRLKELNCSAPAFVAARAAAQRLEKNRRVIELLGESIHAREPSSIRKCLEAWRTWVDAPSLSVEERQLILLSMVHPLWVRLEETLYRDAHTAESEEAFNQAIAALEKARDLDRSSDYGRRAYQLREELRKARLAAARYD